MICVYQDEFDQIEDAAADRRRGKDFDDLQSEMRGDEVGRISRHLPVEAQILLDKRNGKSSRVMSALEAILMSNPAYAVLHRQAVDETRAAQIVAHKFQDDVEIALARVNVEIERMLDDAVTLPDGRKAFMDKDGEAWTVGGELVDEAIAAGINWDGTPPREDYEGLLSRRELVENSAQRGNELSLRLGEIYVGVHDEGEPPSPEQIEAYREEVQNIEAEYKALGDGLSMTGNLDADFDLQGQSFNASAVPKL